MELPNLKQKNTKTGFTLVELLVIISIISILSAVGVVSYTSLQKDNRDQKRIRDLTTIKQALELYRFDQHYYPSIPPPFPFGSSLQNPGATKTYLDPVPNEAISGRVYVYIPLPLSCVGTNCINFVLCAKKEGNKNYNSPSECGVSCGSAGNCDIGVSSN